MESPCKKIYMENWAFLVVSVGKNLTLCNVPGLGRAPVRKEAAQYSGLENSMKCIVSQVIRVRLLSKKKKQKTSTEEVHYTPDLAPELLLISIWISDGHFHQSG